MTDAMRSADPFVDAVSLHEHVIEASSWVAARCDEEVIRERERIISEIERINALRVLPPPSCCELPLMFVSVVRAWLATLRKHVIRLCSNLRVASIRNVMM